MDKAQYGHHGKPHHHHGAKYFADGSRSKLLQKKQNGNNA